MEQNMIKTAHEAFELYLSFNNTSDKRLVGMFEKKDNGQYQVKDLRMSDFSRIEQYKVMDSEGNESEPKGVLDITFTPNQSFDAKANSYYYFHWKYTDSNPSNLCEITIDLSQPIIMLTPFDIVDLLYKAQMALAHGNAKTNNQTLDTLTKQLTASGEEVFIYELLQNANDYPHVKGEEVNVEIRLTDNYLLFRHTGSEFSPKNVAALCNANDKDKTDNPDAIGYKGIGFKTVFNHNNYIYLLTGGFSFSYDSEIKRKKANIPWKVTPIWKERTQIDDEYGKLFWESHDNYRVQFAMRPIKHDKLRTGDNSYLAILKRLFKDEKKILFIPNLGRVKVYLDDTEKATFDCCRKSANWCLSDVFENDIDPEITESINAELKDDEENEISRIPVKYKNFKKTGVSFACKVDGRRLIAQDNAIMYCYLPAETANWGFKFFMNSDMIPNGPRDDIERGIDLNFYLAENAGKMFYRWIHSLVKSGQYDYDSIFALIPNFTDCKNRRPVNKGLVERFQKGFESCLTAPLIPTANGEIIPLKDVIWDETMITSSGIISDDQFYAFSEMEGRLVYSSLRTSDEFRKFINRYLPQIAKCNIFTFDDLKDCVKENQEMQSWLHEPVSNGSFLDFLMACQGEKLKEFSKLHIYIDNAGVLRPSSEIYYSGDNVKQALLYLNSFVQYFPHISFDTLDYFKTSAESKWSKTWPTVGFKQLSAGEFVSKVLFSPENKPNVLSLLHEIDISVNFLKYLAYNPNDNYASFDFATIPFINSEGEVVDSFSGKLVFYEDNSSRNKAILKEEWFNGSWAYFINDAYTDDDNDERVWRFLLKKGLVKFFDADTIVKEVLSNRANHSYITEKTTNNLPSSISFVHYVFKNKHHLNDSIDFKSIPLCVADLDGQVSYETCYDINVFTSIEHRFINHSWLEPKWMYKLDEAYMTGIQESDKEAFVNFLHNKFGVKCLTDKSFYLWVAKKNRVAISKKMALSASINKEFYQYLSDNQGKGFVQQENIQTVFADLPYINSKQTIIAKSGIPTRSYLYNSTLADIATESWVPEGTFSIVSNCYDFSGARELFKKLGFEEYTESDFGSFYVNVLKNSITLETVEQVSGFHHFMCHKLTKLNDDQKRNLQASPSYLFSPTGPRKYSKSTDLYIQNDNFDITAEMTSGLLPVFNAIDKSLCDTQEMLEYWKSLGNTVFNTVECNKWLKSKKPYFDETIKEVNQNIKFWRWLKNLQKNRVTYNLNELKGFPVLTFSDRDASGKEIGTAVTSVTDSVYMPNLYHNGIETFANRYGKKRYISELYSTDHNDSAENREWRDFFKTVGIKDDVKDVIRQIITKDLSNLQDEFIPAVLVEQFSNELETEWDSLKRNLVSLQVKLKNASGFMPISKVLIVDTMDYSTEPLPFISIATEIASSYMDNSEVRKLIRKIAESAGTTIIKNRAEWMRAKVNSYISIQSTITVESPLFSIHTKFIEAFADIYERNNPNWGFDSEAQQIKLFDKQGVLRKPSTLTLGHIYNPFCDFEGNGVTDKTYVNDIYAQFTNRNSILNLFNVIWGVQMTFRESDLVLLSNADFCKYYWKTYLPSHDQPQTDLLDWVKKGLLKDKCCIPNRLGLVTKAELLYSPNIKDYVEKKVGSWEQKIPDVAKIQGKIKDILDEMKFKGALDFADCLDNLLNTAPDSPNRPIVLGWIASQFTEDKRELIATYRKADKAIWLNGQKNPAHIASLYALSNHNNKRISTFRTNAHIIDPEKFKSSISVDNWFKALKCLEVPVISDDDLEPNCPISKDETQTIRQTIKFRLLALISSREGTNWNTTYSEIKNKLSICRFVLCTNIAYKYNELSTDNEKFFCKNNTFYYIKSWQSKQVFTRLVSELNEYLKLQYDDTAINDILDFDEYTDSDIIDFISEKCVDLFDSISFITELEHVYPGINKLLAIPSKGEETNSQSTENSNEEIASVAQSNTDKSYNPYDHNSKNDEVITDLTMFEKNKPENNNKKESEYNKNPEGYGPGETVPSEADNNKSKSLESEHSTLAFDNSDNSDHQQNKRNGEESETSYSHPMEDEQSITDRKSRSDLGGTHQRREPSSHESTSDEPHPASSYSGTSDRAEHQTEERKSFTDRLKDKWNKQKNAPVQKPHSSRYADNIDVFNSPSSSSPAENTEGFFDEDINTVQYTQNTNSTSGSNPLTDRRNRDNFSNKQKAAQEELDKAMDQADLNDAILNTKKYTFLWFKYLMEQLYNQKNDTAATRSVQIDFKEAKVLDDNTIAILKPNRVVPKWIEHADDITLHILKGDVCEKIEVNLQYFTEDAIWVSYENASELETKINEADKVRLVANGTYANHIDSLTKQFVKLDLPDDYSLRDNLPDCIKYIYGPPGTGKTTKLVGKIQDIVQNSQTDLDILVLTPTNKAADVIASRLSDNDAYSQYTYRFGITENLEFLETNNVYTRNDSFIDNDGHHVVITTAARYAYDYLMPNEEIVCDHHWDYVIIDEASMMDIVTMAFILFKSQDCQFIISGDPQQIQPVKQNEVQPENIYQMVGLNSFAAAQNNPKVECLNTQYRSIPTIGDLVSKFSYNGIVKPNRSQSSQKSLNLGFKISSINYIGFKTELLDNLYGLDAIDESAFHLYSAIFGYEYASYISRKVEESNPSEQYSIGIVCPYKKQADSIKQMIELRDISNESCKVQCGTVHSFQGDECDIMIVVLNPPINVGKNSHVNNQNIINVAVSRAKDYVFFLVPDNITQGFPIREVLGSLSGDEKNVLFCNKIEKVMFGQEDYIEKHTNVTCHMPVNVYYEPSSLYEVRKDDSAVDIQINEQFR